MGLGEASPGTLLQMHSSGSEIPSHYPQQVYHGHRNTKPLKMLTDNCKCKLSLDSVTGFNYYGTSSPKSHNCSLKVPWVSVPSLTCLTWKSCTKSVHPPNSAQRHLPQKIYKNRAYTGCIWWREPELCMAFIVQVLGYLQSNRIFFFFFLCIIHIWLIFFFQKVFTISLIPHSQEALSPPMLSLNPTTIPCIYPRFIFHTSAQLLTTETTFWDSLQLATPLLPWTKLPQLI